MAHSLSAKKRIRQNDKRRSQNRARKAVLKDSMKQFDTVLSTGDTAKSVEALKAAVKKIDQIAAKGAIHRNTASRRKSLLMRKLNAAKAVTSK